MKRSSAYIEQETSHIAKRVLSAADIVLLSEDTNLSEFTVSMIVKGKKMASPDVIGVIMDKVREKIAEFDDALSG